MTNALAIVAHHDDHILWMGGTILRTNAAGWNWTVIAMCVPDSEKKNYFVKCCEDLKAKPIAIAFEDYQQGDAFNKNDRGKMRSILTETTEKQKFDWIFTHSRHEACEYGHHANHKEVQSVVASMVSEGKLGHGLASLAYFSYAAIYGCGGLATVATMDKAQFYLQMTYPELMLKGEWCKHVTDTGSLESLGFPCPNPEAFEGDGLQLPVPFIRK